MGYLQKPEISGKSIMNSFQPEILKLDNLTIGYVSGRNASALIYDINKSVYEGEMIAVVGRNGAGKSTLLRTITGLQKPLKGNIFIKGRSIKEYSGTDLARAAGYLSTEPVRVPDMRVYDMIALGRFPHTGWFGIIDNESHRKIIESAESAGVSAFIHRPVNELSDGEYQRAMIARIIAQDSSLFLLDEPVAFLDVRSRFEILSLLYDLSRKCMKTILFTTHDFETAAAISDKIWLLRDGKIDEGAPEDLYLSGQIESLFRSPIVDIEFRNGTFRLRKQTSGKVAVTGEVVYKFWTERAMERIGLEPCQEDAAAIKVITPSDNKETWTLITDQFVGEFNSLYSLTRWFNAGNQ